MNVEHIPAEDVDMLPCGADWQSRHLESEKRKAEIRDRIHKQAEQGQKTAKDYFRPAKPTPSIYDSDLKRVAVYARVSTSSEEQISSIENQTLYYTKKIAETENWNLQDIYSDEGKSGTSLRKRDAFKRMMQDAKDQKMDLIICASISRFARNFSDCMTQIAALKTMHPAHPIGVYFETENIYTLNPSSQYSLDIQALLADWESGNKSRRINAESIRSLCLSTYLPEEVAKLNKMAEMRSGKKLDMALPSDYLTVPGTCFINRSSPVMTISKNGIRFSKACHTRLDDCEDVELLYHPILQVVILRKNNCKSSTAMRWRDDNDVHSAFSARAFSELVFQTLNWRRNCRYQCRGICQERENAKFLLFELDESRILIGKNHYEQADGYSMNLECRLYRHKWVQGITARDVMEFGQVVENPMIGAIPSRNEVQRELDDLLMSM